MTAWDMLRTDWTHLIEAIQEDENGRIEVHTLEGGTIQILDLCNPTSMGLIIKELMQKHPDPIEIVIRAEHEERLTLRSRHRLHGGMVSTKKETN
jgi:hypothetical protein